MTTILANLHATLGQQPGIRQTLEPGRIALAHADAAIELQRKMREDQAAQQARSTH
jgi:hypothetical protein